ncbi:MAG TPA: NAD(P)H-binding protein [Holophagaceae bacterium]|nr:NAD(P)H-binding protein [Holophagaceae bacterium]
MRDRDRILVIGGTGRVGRELVPRLLARNATVRVVTRDVQRAANLFEFMNIPPDHLQDLEFTQGDLDDPGIFDLLLEETDRAFLLSSATPRMAELQGHFIQAAKGAELKNLVRLSTIGADPASPVSLYRWHGQADELLEKSGVPHNILRSHYFIQNLMGFASSVSTHHDFHAPMGEGRIGLVDVRDVAEGAAALVLHGEEGTEPMYRFTGPESLSFREIAAEMSEAFEIPVAYISVSQEEARREYLAQGLSPWLSEAFIELYDYFHMGNGDFTTGDVERLLGHRPRTVRAFLREHAAAFTGRTAPVN